MAIRSYLGGTATILPGSELFANSDGREMKLWLGLGAAASVPDAPLLLQTKTELVRDDNVTGAPRCWDHALGCWDCWPTKGNEAKEVFYLHISKTAGCSAVADLSRMVGRQNIFSYETCYPWASEYNFSHSFVIFRRPRDHVLSAYNYCRIGGQAHYEISQKIMPNSFQEP